MFCKVVLINQKARFTVDDWYEYFFSKKSAEKQNGPNKLYKDVTNYFTNYYSFLEKEQITGKVLDFIGVPNLCGKILRSKLKTMVKKLRRINKNKKRLDIKITKLKYQSKEKVLMKSEDKNVKNFKIFKSKQNSGSSLQSENTDKTSKQEKNYRIDFTNSPVVNDPCINEKKTVRFNHIDVICYSDVNTTQSEIQNSLDGNSMVNSPRKPNNEPVNDFQTDKLSKESDELNNNSESNDSFGSMGYDTGILSPIPYSHEPVDDVEKSPGKELSVSFNALQIVNEEKDKCESIGIIDETNGSGNSQTVALPSDSIFTANNPSSSISEFVKGDITSVGKDLSAQNYSMFDEAETGIITPCSYETELLLEASTQTNIKELKTDKLSPNMKILNNDNLKINETDKEKEFSVFSSQRSLETVKSLLTGDYLFNLGSKKQPHQQENFLSPDYIEIKNTANRLLENKVERSAEKRNISLDFRHNQIELSEEINSNINSELESSQDRLIGKLNKMFIENKKKYLEKTLMNPNNSLEICPSPPAEDTSNLNTLSPSKTSDWTKSRNFNQSIYGVHKFFYRHNISKLSKETSSEFPNRTVFYEGSLFIDPEDSHLKGTRKSNIFKKDDRTESRNNNNQYDNKELNATFQYLNKTIEFEKGENNDISKMSKDSAQNGLMNKNQLNGKNNDLPAQLESESSLNSFNKNYLKSEEELDSCHDDSSDILEKIQLPEVRKRNDFSDKEHIDLVRKKIEKMWLTDIPFKEEIDESAQKGKQLINLNDIIYQNDINMTDFEDNHQMSDSVRDQSNSNYIQTITEEEKSEKDKTVESNEKMQLIKQKCSDKIRNEKAWVSPQINFYSELRSNNLIPKDNEQSIQSIKENEMISDNIKILDKSNEEQNFHSSESIIPLSLEAKIDQNQSTLCQPNESILIQPNDSTTDSSEKRFHNLINRTIEKSNLDLNSDDTCFDKSNDEQYVLLENNDVVRLNNQIQFPSPSVSKEIKKKIWSFVTPSFIIEQNRASRKFLKRGSSSESDIEGYQRKIVKRKKRVRNPKDFLKKKYSTSDDECSSDELKPQVNNSLTSIPIRITREDNKENIPFSHTKLSQKANSSISYPIIINRMHFSIDIDMSNESNNSHKSSKIISKEQDLSEDINYARSSIVQCSRNYDAGGSSGSSTLSSLLRRTYFMN